MHKLAALRTAIRDGFAARGIATAQAAVVAEIAVSLLNLSVDEWLDQTDERTLFEVIQETLKTLQNTLIPIPSTIEAGLPGISE